MKIIMPVNNNSMDSGISNSFGRSTYYLVYDVESKESTYLDNTAAGSQGGAGIKAAQIIVDSKSEILITPRCGQNAADVLKAADIKLYKTINDSIEDNIQAFIDGKLPLLEEIHEGHHNHGRK